MQSWAHWLYPAMLNIVIHRSWCFDKLSEVFAGDYSAYLNGFQVTKKIVEINSPVQRGKMNVGYCLGIHRAAGEIKEMPPDL